VDEGLTLSDAVMHNAQCTVHSAQGKREVGTTRRRAAVGGGERLRLETGGWTLPSTGAWSATRPAEFAAPASSLQPDL
jgi:hypothetical protein